MLALGFSYWSDPRIHNLGNVGVGGAVHAALAPLSTHIIDCVAYKGDDLRARVRREHIPPGTRTVDLCCGVGFSTQNIGVDTSEQMLSVARPIHGRKEFHLGNAETWGDTDAFDTSTCMFAFHEMPRRARRCVLRNMLRIAPVELVVDIAPDYVPSDTMLSGEPYVHEYLENMDEDAREFNGALRVLVPGHAVLWRFERVEK